MTAHLISYEAYDVLQEAIPNAVDEISTDAGQSFRPLTDAEQKAGLQVADGQHFVARISRPGLWPVTQALVVTDDQYVAFDGNRDFGAAPLFSHSTGQVDQWRHILHGALTLFRDGGPDRKAHGCPDVPPYMYNILKFGGLPVLNQSGTGFGRFAATLQPNVPSFGTNGGRLLFLKTTPNAILNMPGEATSVPELTAVYVPPGLDVAQPVSMHVFFSPFTGPKKGDYPYGTGHDSFSEMTDNYLTSGGKRFINQCNASGKRVVFVFPLAPREGQFRGILSAKRTRRFLLEIAYFLQRDVGGSRFPFTPPRLGVCSASCFSAGVQSLLSLISSSMDEDAFPELKEIYSLDGYPGAADSLWIDMAHQISMWWKGGSTGRSVRLYSHYAKYADPAFRPAFAREPTVEVILPNSSRAFATDLPSATFVNTPQPFWEGLVDEVADGAGYFGTIPAQLYHPGEHDKDGAIHQLMPSFFLEHALANSTHP